MNRLISNNEALQQKLRSLNNVRKQILAENSQKEIITFEGAEDIILQCWKKGEFRRIVVGIGGFPASGKTTAAKLIVRSINDFSRTNLAVHLPMDGFHFSNKNLLVKGLDKIKGHITTYHVSSYVKKLIDYKQSDSSSLFAPDYIREKHDVFENRIEVTPEVRILVTEGIYVGCSIGQWRTLRKLIDILFYLDTTPEQCADRIISRNLEVGRSEPVIEKKLSNDFWFMETSIQILKHADYIVRPDGMDVCFSDGVSLPPPDKAGDQKQSE